MLNAAVHGEELDEYDPSRWSTHRVQMQTHSDAEHQQYLSAHPSETRRIISILLLQRSDDFTAINQMIYPSSLTSVSPSFCLSSHLSSPLRRTTSSRTRVTLLRAELWHHGQYSTRVPSLPAITLTHSGLLPTRELQYYMLCVMVSQTNSFTWATRSNGSLI